MPLDLRVSWTTLSSHSILPVNQACFISNLAYTKEPKHRLREKNIMNDMLVNRGANIMSLEMRFGKRILNLEIQLITLNHSHFALACSHRITRTWNLFRVKQTFRLSRGSNQITTLDEYRIRRLAPNISASFIGKCLFKHSDAAEIRKRSLSRGRERMKDATVTSVPSRQTFSNAFGMAFSL